MVERVVVGPWKTNCYIYSSAKKECIIIDPGGSEKEIEARVDVLNMVPVGIALTHGHVDHLAGLARLREIYVGRGYKLPIAINSADRRFLGTGGREIHRESLEFLGLDELSFFGVDPDELPKADQRLTEGSRVFNMDIVVMETPGHTPGSVCFYSEKEGILFSGDTLFFDGVGRTDLPGGSEKKLRESIQKKIAVLPPEVRVFPGHGPFTTVEREKRGNTYFRIPPIEVRPVVAPASPVARKTGAPAAKHAAHAPARPAAHARARPAAHAPARPAVHAPARPAARKGIVKVLKAVVKARIKPAAGTHAPVPGKKAVSVKRSPAASRGKKVKKPAQARRSTKAPGSGRKRAR
jgi:hydroxyacylglutathione hydrolase